jgi:hypothetical protein
MGGWTFKKEVSIGDLVAIGAAVIGVILAYATLDKRLNMVEHAVTVQKERDSAQDQESIRYQARIEESLRALNNKLDRLIERR